MALIITVGPAPAVTQLATPTLVVTPNVSGTNNACTWGAISGATQYRIMKSIPAVDGGIIFPSIVGREYVITSPTLNFDDGGITPGVERYYRLRAEAPDDPTKSSSEWHQVGPILTTPASGAEPPDPDTYSLHIPGKPNAAPYNMTGGQGSGGVTFWITDRSDSSSYTAWPGKSGHYYGTFRGARDLGFTLSSSTRMRVYALVSGRIATTGFFSWTKANSTIDFSMAPSPGLFFSAGFFLGIQADNYIICHTDASMDNNTTVAGMDNRDVWYFGSGYGVFHNNSGRWSCDEICDMSDRVSSNRAGFCYNFLSEPLSNAGRLGDDATHGYSFIIAYDATDVDVSDNVFAHNNGRDIHCRASGVNFDGNVIYNCGFQSTDPVHFAGWTELAADSAGGGKNYFMNVRGNRYIPGPNSTVGFKPITVINNTSGVPSITSSSRFCIKDNYYLDYTGTWTWNQSTGWLTSAVTVAGDALPGSLLTTTDQTAIAVTGYNVWTLTLTAGQPDATEFADSTMYIVNHAGARPGDRSGGRDAIVAGHIENWLAQNGGPYGEIIDDESEAGGHFAVANNSIADPFAASAFGSDPHPDPSVEADTVVCLDGQTRMLRDTWRLRRQQDVGVRRWGQVS